MPQLPEQKQQALNNNSGGVPPTPTITKPSLLRRLYGGGVMSESTARDWPELQRSWAGREIEMPDETMATNRVRPMNFIERSLMPNAQATAYPWGTIALNRKSIEDTQSDLGDVLVHELAHIGQGRKEGMLGGVWNNLRQLGGNYLTKDYEKEAFEKEQNRKVRRFDINLPNPDRPLTR